MQLATFTLRRVLSGKTLKAWRNAHSLSAHDLALELGVSRSYIKSIEGGSLAASQKLIQRFEKLRALKGEGTAVEAQPKSITVVSRFEIPATIEILSKPRKCRECKKYFIPVTPNQRTHTTEACRKNARQRQRAKQKRRR